MLQRVVRWPNFQRVPMELLAALDCSESAKSNFANGLQSVWSGDEISGEGHGLTSRTYVVNVQARGHPIPPAAARVGIVGKPIVSTGSVQILVVATVPAALQIEAAIRLNERALVVHSRGHLLVSVAAELVN